jgi:2-O-(6-phospho-alpha-D-mannosyl)-D-glycerate hydrolase
LTFSLSFPARVSSYVFHLIPHTHWDREWYLPEAAFRARLVRMLDDLLDRLAAESAYRSFLLDGQTVLVEDYLRVRPEREAEVRALIKTGRLQIGPWYVLADELLPSGEALVRNLLAGGADAERHGARLDVGYSPDAFGHPAMLPAILNGFAIRSAALWRGLPAAPDAVDWYRWRAPGPASGPGSREVLLYHLPPEGYESGADLPAEREALRKRWETLRAGAVARARGRHVPVFVGADHHAAHPALPRVRDLLAELYPSDSFRISRLDECLSVGVAETAALQTIEGELRWSYGYTWTLQGVHSTRMPIKQANARLELWLEREVEPLVALARRRTGAPGGGRDARALLDQVWRTLLQNQFHDSLGGCHADPVTHTMATRFAAVESLARELTKTAVRDLVRHDPDAARDGGSGAPALVVWNGAPRPRGGVVLADVSWFREDVLVGPPQPERVARRQAGPPNLELVDASGRAMPVQVVGRSGGVHRLDADRHYPDADVVDALRIAAPLPIQPGFGMNVYRLRAAQGGRSRDRSSSTASVAGRTIRNSQVEVSVHSDGTIEMKDRASGERFPRLFGFESGGDVGDTYTYCPPRRDSIVRVLGGVRIRRVAAGPWVAALALSGRLAVPAAATGDRKSRSRSRVALPVTLTVALHADSPVVRVVVEVTNTARDHRLRVRIPTSVGGTAAVAGAAFGPVRREAVTVDPARFPMETPVRTAPFHRHVSVARGARGLTLFGLGTPEYELTPDGTLLVTLLRGVGQLSRGDLATRRGHAGWPTPTPAAQCLGEHRYQFGVLAHGESTLDEYRPIMDAWDDTFVGPRGFFLRDAVELDVPAVGVALEGRGLVFSSCKPAQVGSGNQTVLRCYNALDAPVHGGWRFAEGVKTAHRTRLDEREATPMVLEERGRALRFTAEPREIVTILIT